MQGRSCALQALPKPFALALLMGAHVKAIREKLSTSCAPSTPNATCQPGKPILAHTEVPLETELDGVRLAVRQLIRPKSPLPTLCGESGHRGIPRHHINQCPVLTPQA